MVRGSMFWFWSVLLTLMVKALVTQGETCTARRLDICFLIDQSSSMESRETYDKLLSFVVKLGSRFAIGQSDVHVSAVIFSDTKDGKTYVYFYLNHLYNKGNFSQKIMSAPWDGGDTRIDVALMLANTEVFTKENGARDDAQKIVFLLTDGQQTNPTLNDPVIQAQELLKRNVHIYAIGVGISIDQKELNSITGDRSKVFYKSTFDNLLTEEFIKNITSVACKAVPTSPRPIITTTTTTTTTVAPPRPITQCKNRRLDICFLIDQSSSIDTDERFNKMLTFVVRLGSRFDIGKGEVHVSAVIFSDYKQGSIYVHFYLNNLFSKKKFTEKIMSTPFVGGNTRIDVALNLTNTKVFTKEKGARDDAQKIVFLLTDGQQTSPKLYDPVIPARALRERGTKIYAIGVTDDINRGELEDITGNVSNVFYQSTFEELLNEEFVKNITEAECKSTPVTRRPATTTVVPTQPITKDPKCEQRVLDICFLIDQSSSIRSKETYDKMLSFVVKLGSRFAISQDNVHVSAVIFSDTEGGKTYVYFYLKHLYTKDNFSEKIMAAPWEGGNTRIDMALKLANTKVFTKENGVRDHAQKIIFLLTDGQQSSPNLYDPGEQALALRKRGVKIYAIGVGIEINKAELNSITGDPSKVFYQNTFDELLNEDFVLRITEAECKSTPATQPPNTTLAPTQPTDKPCVEKCCTVGCCRGVSGCGTCCSGTDVYNIVFHPNSGPNYVFTGLKIHQTSQDGSQIGISVPPKSPGVNVYGNRKQNGLGLAMLVKKARADKQFRSNLVNILKLLDENSNTFAGKRRRRSVDDKEYDTQTVDQLTKFASVAGCKKFLAALKRKKLMHKVTDLMKEGKKISIFCPVDSAYNKIKNAKRRNILLNHIAVKHGQLGTMYHTLSGGKISLTPAGNNPTKVSWKANGANVLSSIIDGTGNEIMIIDDIIHPVNNGMLDFLKGIDDVSIFYKILRKSPLRNIIKSLVVKKVCFAKDICLQVTPAMQEHLKDVITFKQFTILVPTNSMFSNTSKSELDTLINDPVARKAFIQKHIFVGSLGNPSTKNKDIGYSLSPPNHSVLTMNIAKDRKMLLDAEDRLFQVLRSLPVTEGLVHIVKNLE